MTATDRPYEVCIIGAGITGLNALAVASKYLSKSDRILLVDSRARVGGMWVDTYDYVRLHQPHGMFTAGNIKWTLGQPRAHLASKPEVLDHLQHCVDVTRQRVALDERFGWNYTTHEDEGDSIRVTIPDPDGQPHEIHTKRLIKAYGNRIVPKPPLPVSSSHVHSTTPERLSGDGVFDSDAPVWIVGAGKTAMDTAHTILSARADREVNLIAGPGVVFYRRETFFPTGAQRWWRGTSPNSGFRQITRRFDGTNEDDVRQWLRSTYSISPVSEATDFLGAYLSDAECDFISSHLHRIECEYFADIVDVAGTPELVYRSGRTEQLVPGSFVVNCTGSLLRDGHPYEPFVSAAGKVLSIQMRSSVTGPFSSFGGYFLTHLMFRDKLDSIGLYELDIEDLQAKSKTAVLFASLSVTLYNIGLMTRALPPKVLNDCGLDFDRWYPMPRRMIGTFDLLLNLKKDGVHHRETLDTVRERYGVRCGPLPAA